MLNAKDKNLKNLKESHLMQVAEFHKMVLALQRFKEDLAVKSITGKKNIRSQKTPDRIFFSVLEKMLLEVSSSHDMSFHKAEQQLLSLRKVFLWFESNKHVLMKSDGYFKAARKITEDIYEKQLQIRLKKEKLRSRGKKTIGKSASSLKTIDVHLDKLHQAEKDVENKPFRSDTSMFARSPTQDLTSVDSATIGEMGNYEEDLYFAREVYEHEYMGGNKIERLNRPMTAPLKLKRGSQPLHSRVETPTEVSFQSLPSQEVVKARPQSALTQVHHDLSWAKSSPLPLAELVRKNAGLDDKKESAEKKHSTKAEPEAIFVDIPTASAKPLFQTSAPINDPKKIANLVMFKQFCVEHSAQQENYMRQYTHHKHGTRQHFLEFPENSTENIVRQTANTLYDSHQNSSASRTAVLEKMGAYRGMSLEEFLDLDTNEQAQQSSSQHDEEVEKATASTNEVVTKNIQPKVPCPPTRSPHSVVQPLQSPVKISSVCQLAAGTGKRMNSASEQALSAPKHGWRYPMVPIASFTQPEVSKGSASGVVLALQEEDLVQHRVLIPLAVNSGDMPSVQDQGVQTNLFYEDEAESGSRPKSSFTTIADIKGSSIPSRPSTRPWSSPRYVTEVRAILQNRAVGSRSCFDMRPNLEHGDNEIQQRSLRSAGTATPNRPRTAASWGSYPAKSEVSRSFGAASHHSTGVLRHRTVAETMRVKSVNKRLSYATSGRSSASSYVAQLREKKRAGARINAQNKPGAKRSVDYEQMVRAEDELGQKPHLSFIQIASPMQIPTDKSLRTYARPGGVYCGSTAAVVVASEGQVNIMDDAMSDGRLSYEDFFMNTPAEEQGDADAKEAGDNWLSQWLSGGPLDGLHDAATGNGKATTYADLVSRAAIIDSSDDRTYTEEVPSSTSAVGGLGVSPRENISLSPKEDFSISPRTDPLISHRTTTSTGQEEEEELTNSQEIYTGYTPKHQVAEEDEDARSSGRLSSELVSSKSSDLSSGYKADEDENEMNLSESDEFNDELLQEEKKAQENNDLQNQETFPETEQSENKHERPEVLESLKTDFTSEKKLVETKSFGGSDFHEKLDSVDNLRTGQNVTDNEQTAKPPTEEETRDDGGTDLSDVSQYGALQKPDVLTHDVEYHQNQSAATDPDAPDHPTEAVTDDVNEDDSGQATEEYDDDDSFRSETLSSYRSMTQSEAEMLSDSSPVRIVVTSARKVERELLERQASGNAACTPSPPESAQGISRHSVAAQTKGDYEDSDAESHMITREEVSAVVSLSRPQSGRPIPSEAEVRDPFVDFVASTRQKQVDRSVDVQAIFSGTSDESEQKPDPALEKKREEEHEAAIKMQRAYRHHLARMKAARKCQGLSADTLEWARSYKAMLLEKKEMRKRRLREARQSSRSLQKREAKKMSMIGPHKEVYEIYHPEPVFPDVEVIQESAVELQRLIRGWLVRRKLEKVRLLVEKRESTVSATVGEYRSLLERTQTRHGKLKPSLSLTYEELIDYLRQREKFELAFKKREFWNEMESSELTAFFNDCGLFPSQDEISEAVEAVTKSLNFSSKKKKHSETALLRDDVIEIAFYIYIPAGARMDNQSTRSSTWMTPICEGEEGLKLIEAANGENVEVESADIQVVSHFVAQVFKERKKIEE